MVTRRSVVRNLQIKVAYYLSLVCLSLSNVSKAVRWGGGKPCAGRSECDASLRSWNGGFVGQIGEAA